MTVRVFTGSKQQIARDLAGIDGDVREAIVFVDEPAGPAAGAASSPARDPAVADLFAEMDPYTVAADDLDDSRAAIYSRGEGE